MDHDQSTPITGQPHIKWTAEAHAYSEDLLPASASDSFVLTSTEMAHGLGLTFTPPVTDQTFDVAPQPSTYDSMPFLVSDWTAAQVLHGMDSYDGSYTSSCTVQPTAWQPGYPNSATLEREESSSISSYSTSSHPSAASSPYVRPGSIPFAAESPAIKVEYPSPPHVALGRYRHIQAAPEQSLLVKPSDLVSQPASFEALTSPPPDAASESDATSSTVCNDRPVLGPRREDCNSDVSAVAAFACRPRRELTKPENANWFCDMCQRPFARHYNLKEHMTTHNKARDRPHGCEYAKCTQRFVRRADLTRHENSVHMRLRQFSCPMCRSTFARKDTLSRHVDSGCPMRAEVHNRCPTVWPCSTTQQVAISRVHDGMLG